MHSQKGCGDFCESFTSLFWCHHSTCSDVPYTDWSQKRLAGFLNIMLNEVLRRLMWGLRKTTVLSWHLLLQLLESKVEAVTKASFNKFKSLCLSLIIMAFWDLRSAEYCIPPVTMQSVINSIISCQQNLWQFPWQMAGNKIICHNSWNWHSHYQNLMASFHKQETWQLHMFW